MYQALYRQYRPKTFEELLGQEHVVVTLKNQIVRENIGHAYLFSGTRGTGKTSAAKIFSRAVNCLEPVNGNPCNECENCKEILNESSMDVIEMDAASHNSVDDIRDLREKVVYPPSKLKFKVYIIDEVHMLSKGAFNALLKTLEEPPKHLIFILATTEPERLPQTILSRCQRFDFRRIINMDIIYNMRNIVDDLGINVDDEVLKLIARNSDGAMRDALSLLDQCISYEGDNISYEDAISILGVTNIDLIFDLVDDIKAGNMEKSLDSVDGIIQDGKDIIQFVKDLMMHFRNLMIIKSSNNPEEYMEMDNLDRYIEQSEDMDLEYILNALDILTEIDNKIKWASQPRIVLEMAIIKMVRLKDKLSLEERVERLEEGYTPAAKPMKETRTYERQENVDRKEVKSQDTRTIDKKPESKEAKVSKEESPTIEEGQELDINIIRQEWPQILNKIRSRKINIYALIMEGEVLDFDNDMITIGYEDAFDFHKEAISSENNKNFVEEVISEYFNKDIKTNFIMAKKKVINKKDKDITPKNDKNEDIDKAIEFFGSNIVKIK